MAAICRICKSGKTGAFHGVHGRYLRCDDCHAVIRDITKAEYGALKPSYDPGPDTANVPTGELRAFLGVDEKKVVLRPLVEGVRAGCRVLDVGCGAGGYLLAAQELGCVAAGVEPSRDHATVGRALGLDIRHGYFEPGLFERESADVVILSHVIEHIYEPREFLASLFELVRPGGCLVVVTPNSDSVVARWSGRHWVMLKPIDHVSMLSERSFRAMGVESWGNVSFVQSEFVWEPLASLMSAGLGAFRSLRSSIAASRARQPTGREAGLAHDEKPARARLAWAAGAAPLRTVLSIAGSPLHQIATAQNRQACLRMQLTKPIVAASV